MLTSTFEKIDEVDTKIGHASVLRFGQQRLLSFPSFIDKNSKVSMLTYHSTLVWPTKCLLNDIADFPTGPALPGYLLLSLEQLFSPADKTKNRSAIKRPRHIRHFIGNVLAELAATLIAGQ